MHVEQLACSPLDILNRVRKVLDLGIHRGTAIALIVA
jgi:hypothetical protein